MKGEALHHVATAQTAGFVHSVVAILGILAVWEVNSRDTMIMHSCHLCSVRQALPKNTIQCRKTLCMRQCSVS